MLYQCRDVTSDPDDSEDEIRIAADDPEQAARLFAKSCELGHHETQEMIVRVLDPESGAYWTFKVETEWEPRYSATEIEEPP